VEELPEVEAQEVLEVFEAYGLTHGEAVPIVDSLRLRPKQWVDFMMRFELGLEEPDPKRAVRSASTIAGAYIAGGLIPLAPYMLLASASTALMVSIVATILALAIFGAVKAQYTGMPLGAGALRTAFIGGLAAAAAFGIARLVSGGK
jgi:vacuolar iron transporter family protein